MTLSRHPALVIPILSTFITNAQTGLVSIDGKDLKIEDIDIGDFVKDVMIKK